MDTIDATPGRTVRIKLAPANIAKWFSVGDTYPLVYIGECEQGKYVKIQRSHPLDILPLEWVDVPHPADKEHGDG